VSIVVHILSEALFIFFFISLEFIRGFYWLEPRVNLPVLHRLLAAAPTILTAAPRLVAAAPRNLAAAPWLVATAPRLPTAAPSLVTAAPRFFTTASRHNAGNPCRSLIHPKATAFAQLTLLFGHPEILVQQLLNTPRDIRRPKFILLMWLLTTIFKLLIQNQWCKVFEHSSSFQTMSSGYTSVYLFLIYCN